MNLSNNDKLLMGNGSTPDIQPDSQYDQTIAFSGSDSSQDGDDMQGNPGQFSPRPGMDMPSSNARPSAPGGRGFAFGSDSDDNLNTGGNNFASIGGGMGFSNDSPKGIGGFGNSLSGGNDRFGLGSPLGGSGGFGTNGGFGAGNDFSNYSPRPNATDASTSSPELAQLFGLITSFQPQPIEITPHFKPFLPDLVPAIGSIDAFIKVPRPDDEVEPLGLTVLDEPTIGCSDPQIIKMQLREKYGIVSNTEGDGYIGYIEDLDNNQKALDTFLENYEEMIRDRPAPSIVYSYKMPDLNDLLLEWPPELDKALESIPLPTADMDLTIEEYAKIICAFLDIPVKGNVIESLHVFFTLFMTFEENQHFPVNDTSSVRNENIESLKLD